MAVLLRTIENISVNQPQPLVGQVLVNSQGKNNKFYSCKLLNYVESIEIGGILKTVFFSEVNTNFNVGDRVFIINGNYDSQENYKDRYKKFSDGYRVLAINGCRIILDIDYNGDLPFEEFRTKNFIFIHHIESQKDFDYINSQKISIEGNTLLKSIFSGNILNDNVKLECQNILYTTQSFLGSSDLNLVNGGVSGKGFWVRADDGVNNFWIDVTQFVLSDKITQNAQFSDSGKLYILGNGFQIDTFSFDGEGVYKFENFRWVIDVKNYTTYISKLNFRFGKFKGVHNDGVYGTYKRRFSWNNATWNSGVLINSDWKGGFMNSKHTVDELSFISRIEQVGPVSTVIQTEDNTNNRGFGYNFIEDSKFITYSIGNGNFFNCLFASQSQYKSSLDIYYGITSSFTNIINGGKYELCDIYDNRSNNAYFLNSSLKNINFNRSKIVSSEVTNSSVDQSFWSTDGGVKILGADLWSFDNKEGALLIAGLNDIVGTIKLYISEDDYLKLRSGDTFYLSKINKDVIRNFLNDDQTILNTIETKFLINNFDDYDIDLGVKSSIQVSISSSRENKWKYQVGSSNIFLPTFGYEILGDDTDYWSKIQMSSFKSAYDPDYDTIVGYSYNDIVYSDDNFYQYIPYNRNVLPDIQRARNIPEFQAFVSGHLGEGLDGVNNISDWVFIGTYSGKWSIDGVYLGENIPEITSPYFITGFASGSVVSDGVDKLNSNQFWIFVGQNSPSGYSYQMGIGIGNIIEDEIPGQNTNAYRYDVVGKQYFSKNYLTESTIDLPSINITSKVFGWFTDENSVYQPTRFNKLGPITPTNINDVFINTVIGNGDFKSGIMNNSTWLSGDNTNYYNNIISAQSSTNLGIILDNYLNKKIIKIQLTNRKYSINYLFDGYDFVSGDYVWLKSIEYIFTTPDTVKSLDGRYRVVRYFTNTAEIWLESAETPDKLSDLQIGGVFYLPKGGTNKYFSIHKFSLSNSKVVSGKFIRTGIDNTTFENDLFIKYVYPLDNIQNTELIRLSNIMFQDTNNQVKSGIVYKSHFINDIFDGGIFYNSFWLNGDFTDGLFKSSVWTGGNFNGGRFVDSRDPRLFTFDFDTTKTTKLWQGGNFNGGEFYNSLWVRGDFNGGRFYFSDWTGGTWSNGVLGSKNIRTKDTTMAFYGPSTSFGATHTNWYNGVVENALVGGFGSIDWYGGKMIGGEFTSEGRFGKTYSIWHDGDFYASSFTKQAWWKNGNFYSGKFLSEIGGDKVSLNSHPSDPFEYGWVNGNFYGGEFGNASKTTNSIWYGGIMEGGIFQGKFWRDGLITNGKFYGSLVTQSDISQSLIPFAQNFYGLWNDGFVDNIIYNVKKDRIVSTEDLEVSSSKTKLKSKIVDMYNVVWKNGTFSHELSTFNNSIWLNGEFNDGNFNNSYFNPFVDLTLVGLKLEDYEKSNYLKQIYDEILVIIGGIDLSTLTLTFYLSQIEEKISQFNDDPQLNASFKIEYTFFEGYASPFPPDYANNVYIYNSFSEFDSSQRDITVFFRIYDEEIINLIPGDFLGFSFYVSPLDDVSNPEDPGESNRSAQLQTFASSGSDLDFVYPNLSNFDNIPYSFNTYSTCIWTGGNFNNGEFNYSKWLGGNFNDGTMNGSIWLDGVFNYGFMNNCYWENGVWRNGNWDGSPFDWTSLSKNNNNWEVTNKKVDQILKNISNYTTNINLHLSNVFTIDPFITSIHTFDASGFIRWTVDEQI